MPGGTRRRCVHVGPGELPSHPGRRALSVGDRQSPSSDVDERTDALVQKGLRESFAGATTITIAHRLHTIVDSDRVLVLDDGRVIEYDAPQTLLADEQGAFRALVDAAKGRSPSQQNLLQLAEDEASARARM